MEANWKQAKEVFQDAIDLLPESRHAFVESSCDDEATKQHVHELLVAHNESGEFLESPIPARFDFQNELTGKTIGNFVVQRRIGAGGMGTVYEATQQNPARRVALKILRNDIRIDEAMLGRFENESQILARLQHPNIAHVYEAGSIESGDHTRPWFAMELIDGCNLKEHVDKDRLSITEKLRIMLSICDAVAHAHSKGVVHRDLKPGNILVAKSDSDNGSNEVPKLKIVDFGIARVIESSQPAHSMTRSILGTLDYVSPEQVNDQLASPDQRCDVFALGVIAFELINGSLPFDRRSGSITSILTRIGFDSPESRVNGLVNLPKDLAIVIGKAIEFEPQQRYQTVTDFADDIRRYLRQEPIAARPASATYRLRKFVRRNRALVAGTLTTIAALLAGIIIYANIANEARQAEEEAQYEASKAVAVNSFITNDFLTELLTKANSKEPLNVAEMVRDASSQVDAMFARRPLLKAAVRNEIGTIYYNLGLFVEASEQYEIALDLWESGLGPDHADTLKAVNNLGQAQMAFGPNAKFQTEELFRRAYAGRKKQLGLNHSATIRSLNNLAEVLRGKEQFAEAESLYKLALMAIDSQAVQDDKTAITIMSNLGSLYLKQRRIDEALQLHKRAHQSAVNVFGRSHVITMQTGWRYVSTLDRNKNFQAALTVLEPLLLELKKAEASNPRSLLSPYRLQARIYRHQGNHQSARSVLNKALEIANKQPIEFAESIEKIERDIDRLNE